MKPQIDPWTENNEQSEQQETMKKEFNLMKNMPTILRIIGAAAVLFAMYSFLMKGWDSGNDSFRYLLMLGHTGLLAILGLSSGYWLKESKGARLLLTLALISIPANFAILGAFIFSQTAPPDVNLYPQYVAWSVDSMSTALLTTVGSLLVLIPVTFLGFTVLARRIAKKLALLFLLSSVALLMPIRDPQLIALLILALAMFGFFLSKKISHNQVSSKTHEGTIALSLQFLPLAVLAGRNLWLYSADLFILTTMSATTFFIVRQISVRLSADSKLITVLNYFSIIPSILVAVSFCGVMIDLKFIPNELILPISALLAAGMLYDISNRVVNSPGRFRFLAISALLIGMTTSLVLYSNILAALICIIVGLSLLVLGFKAQQRNVFSGGILLLLMGLAHQFYEIFLRFELSSWISLAVFGVVAIVVASTIESQGGKLKSSLLSMKNSCSNWE